jgi:hypothetical protein
VFAIPLILWAEARLGGLLIEGKQFAIYHFNQHLRLAVFALGNVVRLIFGYARWAFPKLEFTSERSSVAAHRAALAAILIGIAGSAL